MHTVEAIIAKEAITKDIESRFVLARSIPLAQGYAMIPLTDEFKDDIDDLVGNDNLAYDCFDKLSCSIRDVILDTDRPYEITYIETEYFGGEGSQSSVVWKDGKVVFGPIASTDTNSPINDALRAIGVRVINKQDEFDEMKLGWNRNTDKWYHSSS